MTLWRYLIRHLGLAALQAVVIVVAMLDRSVGIGALIGLAVGAVVLAFRDQRRDQRRQRRRAAEAAALDQRLATLLAVRRPAIDTVAEELS